MRLVQWFSWWVAIARRREAVCIGGLQTLLHVTTAEKPRTWCWWVFFFSFSHVPVHWSYSWEDAFLLLSLVMQWSLCLCRDGHQFSLKSQYVSSLCPMDWATLWVYFTCANILMHCSRYALKCTFKQKRSWNGRADMQYCLCHGIKTGIFLKFLSPVCCPIRFIS